MRRCITTNAASAVAPIISQSPFGEATGSAATTSSGSGSDRNSTHSRWSSLGSTAANGSSASSASTSPTVRSMTGTG
ncbi:hypothetical protein ACFQ2M_12490 [Kitasatospora saccharophila]|uniref:hypothetical protein n=1 Tax=Kitasatospora saccharophila TaxID=407973 RepID=UPI0036386ECC